ncbi:hypothetical protein ACFOUP_18460 [Belliella kenyensis]|uniref:Uncharacterized protein n=1 Tax=Belliella kenyensis TaxID=1472724 RepID=A0ABV8EPV2_9BACT|nr:hypothetical protein [Belliella kenyensis]MCH7402240.1 hypothetical protein [Belliella kenyensis]MDN3601754.1 hypothetical protein [Belliella kenyensis]
MKNILLYYREINSFNLPFSILIGFLFLVLDENFLRGFMLSFISGGMFIALYLFEKRYKEKYYFYFNRGYSKLKLIAYTQVFNVLIFIIYFTLERLHDGK